MAIYRIDHVLNEELWWIENRTGTSSLNFNVVYPNTVEIGMGITVPGESVWVDQPTPLAAFAQALMIFNGENK